MLQAGLNVRKPTLHQLGRVVIAVIVVHCPLHQMNKLVAQAETVRPTALPQRVNERVAIGDRDLVNRLFAEHRENPTLQLTTVPALGIGRRPIALEVLYDELGSLANGRSRTGLGDVNLTRITTLTGNAPILRGYLAGPRQRNGRVRTETDVVAITKYREAEDPAA